LDKVSLRVTASLSSGKWNFHTIGGTFISWNFYFVTLINVYMIFWKEMLGLCWPPYVKITVKFHTLQHFDCKFALLDCFG